MKLFIEKIRANPYLDSKKFFTTLNDDDKKIFLDSLFDIFKQKSIIFSNFLESHPYFENYIIKQDLTPFNLAFIDDSINVMYACMRCKQDFLPSVIFEDIIDSKKIMCVISFEPFSSNFRNNIAMKLREHYAKEIHFFIARKSFLSEINNVIQMQKMAENNELDENFLESLFVLAQKFNASDIHLILDKNTSNTLKYEQNATCLFRINGNLLHFLNIHDNLFHKLSKKLKLLCKIDINDKQIPQDGHFKYEKIPNSNKESYFKNDIRISFLPTLNGESLVLRIPANKQRFHTFKNLNMIENHLKLLKTNLLAKSGLIIISGPTNSAKTTLLYACLRHLNNGSKKILSIEDPIEQEIAGVAQSQVNRNENLTFANALKYVLRQDGDVIMIGEIRDDETLDLSLKAALSGHLVLASIHASDCISSISRMLDLNAQKGLLESVLKCVISQRLLKTLCPFCKEKIDGKFVAKGCNKCYFQGFGERKLIQEMLDFRNTNNALLCDYNDFKEISTILDSKNKKAYFSQSLQEQANALYTQGIIPYEETLL
ncbi:general secretion pathway protein GspE [Helicobacter saguini]|uniref:General secretion pathway protein GspE n=1 Tax=Helicobacter saguini TaxID=1548018 RepID=A0A347VSD8_9HELI|nr:ATPase, T2SS/T4P/T4SS family [Helicobacter saguini]MWV62548.1 general secretion pathway protein GspE [Helicobacter saguini]MWV66778.1 general secretion pathway protein GspE [Helicobacter saguini]MWV69129.1 general secretion pathway protein GspE [Helicobacter saguini]MWV71316.1 general secretion pathway protein GspE [Helicobacter saguini]TLD94174.1 general secretion pathway protein GspE [Helicobacter saguini]